MRTRHATRLVFDARTLVAGLVNDRDSFPDECDAFVTALRGQRFVLVVTESIQSEYEKRSPGFALQFLPQLRDLERSRRVIFPLLESTPPQVPGLRSQHRPYVEDAIGADARYLITTNPLWLRLSEETNREHGLQIVEPRRFVELEGP